MSRVTDKLKKFFNLADYNVNFLDTFQLVQYFIHYSNSIQQSLLTNTSVLCKYKYKICSQDNSDT